jgi:hypothetical protein
MPDGYEGGKVIEKLTKDQAAVVSAYTGYLVGQFSDMHEYAERKLGRPIWTHEFASHALTEELREAAREDFIGLSMEER